MRKNILLLFVVLGTTITLISCSKDDSDTNDDDEMLTETIVGEWEIAEAVGEEWEYDEGVVKTNDPDPEFLGMQVKVTDSKVTIGSNGPFDYTYSEGVLTVDLGGGSSMIFDVTFDSSTVMEWAEQDPEDMEDYEYNEEGNNYLFYQKTWTLELQ